MTTPSLLSRDTSLLVKMSIAMLAIFFFCLGISQAHATVYYWMGAASSSGEGWEDGANWTTTPYGTTAANAWPDGNDDTAVFATSGTTTRVLGATLTVGGIHIRHTYTGTVIIGSGSQTSTRISCALIITRGG